MIQRCRVPAAIYFIIRPHIGVKWSFDVSEGAHCTPGKCYMWPGGALVPPFVCPPSFVKCYRLFFEYAPPSYVVMSRALMIAQIHLWRILQRFQLRTHGQWSEGTRSRPEIWNDVFSSKFYIFSTKQFLGNNKYTYIGNLCWDVKWKTTIYVLIAHSNCVALRYWLVCLTIF